MEINYTPEQQAVIDRAIALTINVRGADYEWSTAIVERQGQRFAVFGHQARQLLDFAEVDNGGNRFEYVPMIVNGNMLEQQPHEGRSGIAYLMLCTRLRGKEVERPEWSMSYISTGWIYTHELELSNAEIMDNIADEVDNGAAHITGGRPGYLS